LSSCDDRAREWVRGVPPGGAYGHSTVISLQFVYALERAAELEERLGMSMLADHYRSVARKVRDAVRTRTWDAARGLFRDRPDGDIVGAGLSASARDGISGELRRDLAEALGAGGHAPPTYSQQTNVMAALTDAVAPADQAALMERVLSDATLTQSSYYFGYYQLEALRKAGLGERYVDQLAPWRRMLDLGLTTVPEAPEPTRSDSHAWSAHPNYGLLATVLGVRPAEPGFKSVRITPHLGTLQRAEGRVPHPRGVIEVRLARIGGSGLRAEVTLPEGLHGVLEWAGKKTALRPGRQDLSF
jgi:alpha-L-rhamnosidase